MQLQIRNRYDLNGNKIEDVDKYEPQHTEELREFLNEIYASSKHNEKLSIVSGE